MEIKPNEKIRVRLESFNHELLNTSCQKIMDITKNNNVDNVEKVEIFSASPGVYTIQVSHKGTLLGGLQNFSLIANGVDGLSLDTRNYNLDDTIFIYPNPATTVLNYNVTANTTITAISIHDISGKVMFSNANLISNTIDIASLSSGVYFVTLQSDKNSVTKKFIKE